VQPETCKYCIESDTKLSGGVPKGEFRLYKCKNNLWDIATPIFVGGHHVGNLFSGQFFFEEETIDREFFRSQARLYGFSEEGYLAALDTVPRLSRDTVEHGMKFLQNLADTISQLGYSNVKLARALAERERAEEAARESTQRLKLMFDRAPLGIVEVNAENQFIAANPSMCQMLGYAREELLGLSIQDVTAPEDRKATEQMNASLRAPGQEMFTYEKHYLKKDGSRVWVNVRVSALRDREGRFTGAIGTVGDITERKQADAEVRRLNEELEGRVRERTSALERANKELEAFSYSVSHDLRSPLRLIGGFAGLLTRQGQKILTERQQMYLTTIQTQITLMDDLIQSLLEFSRLTRKELRLMTVDTRRMVEEVVAEQLEILGSEFGSQVRVEIGGLPAVKADPILLRMVFTNLLSNAFKFSRSVIDPTVRIEAKLTDGFYAFRVQDNGVGFPSGQSERLFKVFQRLHGPGEFEGTGIGLANVRKIVERHGGQVCGEGEEGKGAAFYFTLPIPMESLYEEHSRISKRAG